MFANQSPSPTLFVVLGPLGIQHLPTLPARVAVQVGGEDALLGLVPVEDVVDTYVQAALPGQDLRDSHKYFLHKQPLNCRCY